MYSSVQPGRHEDPELRFAFSRNWKSFLATLDERRIDEARQRLCESLGRSDLHGVRALDVGSGSGLSSLVMHQLGPASWSLTATSIRLYARKSYADPTGTVSCRGKSLEAQP